MRKIISSKYGVDNEKQAQSIIDTMLDNASEQLCTTILIAAENGIDVEGIAKKFDSTIKEKFAQAMHDHLLEALNEAFGQFLDDIGEIDE